MQRTIVSGADLTGEALSDLKSWLGISRPNEDSLLEGLMEAGLSLCEAFTGQAPLVQTVEHLISPKYGWKNLASRPVKSLVSVELVAEDGSRTPLDASAFVFDLEAGSSARFELKQNLSGQSIAVQVTAGIAPDWASMPAPLKQGVIRVAAHHYRDRDAPGDRNSPPPASVAALWRPWRIVRLT